MSTAAASSIPRQPRNPLLLIADIDAVLQLVMSDCISLLKLLQTEYAIQPTIVDAVKTELLLKAERKFAPFRKSIKKALDSETLSVLSPTLLGEKGWASPDQAVDTITKLGTRYTDFVDRGEAFSYAAANLLKLPILSNDGAAISSLLDNRITVPANLLRAFDIVVFGFHVEARSEKDCDWVRKLLGENHEHLPECFIHAGFKAGLSKYFARLLDRNIQSIGSNSGFGRLDVRLWIERRAKEVHLREPQDLSTDPGGSGRTVNCPPSCRADTTCVAGTVRFPPAEPTGEFVFVFRSSRGELVGTISVRSNKFRRRGRLLSLLLTS